jgi:hypothetical protein
MRKLLLLFIGLTFTAISFATSYTSAADGNWSTPTIWSPMGVPQPGDDVIINHNVVMDDTYTVSGYWSIDAGNLTIGANGSLAQGTNVIGIVIQNGGTITNNGTLSFNQLGNYQGTFTNNGTSNFYRLIYNLALIENYGVIQEVDSFYTSGTVNSYNGSSIGTDSTLNEGIIINNGDFVSTYFYNNNQTTNNFGMSFFNFTNNGNFINNAAILVSNDGLNLEIFWNKSTAHINLTRNFTNVDSVNHDALFINDGIFNIGDSWSNMDTTRGASSGEFHIEEGTYNSGYMKGTFLFCDNTPTVTVNPIIDLNTGVIEPGITYCLTNNISEVNDNAEFSVYPNPANLFIKITNINLLVNNIEIIDITGKIVKQMITNQTFNSKIDVLDLKKGFYFVKIDNFTQSFVKL